MKSLQPFKKADGHLFLCEKTDLPPVGGWKAEITARCTLIDAEPDLVVLGRAGKSYID